MDVVQYFHINQKPLRNQQLYSTFRMQQKYKIKNTTYMTQKFNFKRQEDEQEKQTILFNQKHFYHCLILIAIFNNQSMQKKESGTIKVFCRFRPFNSHELENNAIKNHRISNNKQLIIKGLKQQEVSFMFDRVFDTNSTQQEVFEEVGRAVLQNILQGFNGTIMAYGQTSSGKTHTMQGYDLSDKQIKGIMPRIIEALFNAIANSPEYSEFKLKVSIFELYMQKIRDLLDVSKNDLKIRQNKQGPYVEDLTEIYVSDKMQLFKLVQIGQKNRVTCSTNMNDTSSRSHMLFLLTLNQFNQIDSSSKNSKLFLIDLAGSEKISKTGAQGKVLEEAMKINLSLTSLGKVIKALSEKSDKNSHVPYRDSKLTRIIKDSLGGNSKTTLIVTCSPHQMHLPQTISTLRFGQNAQKIKNKPKINKELTVQQLQKIIDKMEIQMHNKTNRLLTLQKYITHQLKASLPPTTYQIQQPTTNTNITTNQQFNQTFDEPEEEKPQKQQKGEKIMAERLIYEQLQKNKENEERVIQLQRQLEQYKITMKKETQKFYQLKKQYNSLHQQISNVITENLQLRESIQNYQNNQQKSQQKQQKNYQSSSSEKFFLQNAQNIKGILGHIFKLIGKDMEVKVTEELKTDKWFQDILKGAHLSDYWTTSREKITNQIQAIFQHKLQKELSKNSQLLIQKDTKNTTSNMLSQKELEKALKQQQKIITQKQNQKLLKLQQKLDQLYDEYYQMITLQTTWKVQCQLYERKLKQKQDRINELQEMMNQMSEQVSMMDDIDTISVKTKIVKPIKGGFIYRK